MKFLDKAIPSALWKGYFYHKNGQIASVHELENSCYYSYVYEKDGTSRCVEIDIKHPTKSKCSCKNPYGKHLVCEHMVAVFFEIHPVEAEKLFERAKNYQKEEEMREREIHRRIEEHFRNMDKETLVDAVLNCITRLPDWECDDFLSRYLDVNELYSVKPIRVQKKGGKND